MKENEFTVRMDGGLVDKLDEYARSTGADRSGALSAILSDFFAAGSGEAGSRGLIDRINRELEEGGVFRISVRRPEGEIHLKSFLRHEFRPELRYALRLLDGQDRLGEISLAIRENNVDSLRRFHQFADDWAAVEEYYMGKYADAGAAEYIVRDGSLKRVLMIPKGGADPSGEALGRAVSEYIRALNTALRIYMSNPGADRGEIERNYIRFIRFGIIF